jgi:hypothetical protein
VPYAAFVSWLQAVAPALAWTGCGRNTTGTPAAASTIVPPINSNILKSQIRAEQFGGLQRWQNGIS